MKPVRAVVFDLYGTLIELERSVFQRQLPRRIGVDRRTWTDFVRRVLLITDFESREAFVDRAIEEFQPPDPETLRAGALELLDEEISSARRFPGVLSLLSFLRRRDLRLGLISNLASPYREPCETLGLIELFDVVSFSCHEGRSKPDSQIYLDHCRKLEVEPEEVLFVGDSLRNDVLAPRDLGMISRRISNRSQKADSLSIGTVGWLDYDNNLGDSTATKSALAPLLAPGQSLAIGGSKVKIEGLDPVSDAEQGRYNLVAAIETVAEDTGQSQPERETFYCKRFLSPESAHLEAFSNLLLREVGLETPDSGVLLRGEPVFFSRKAPGHKVVSLDLTPELAFDIGRHGASAFLFSNADLRPRNAFLVEEQGQRRLVMIDHEHSLFNLALDVTGIDDPENPHVLDALSATELEQRTRKRVLSPAAMRRTHRAFFEKRGYDKEFYEPFREGWTALHSNAQAKRSNLEALLQDRIYTPPFLVIGTRSYRRAFAGLDIADLLARVDLDPTEALDSWMSE